MSQYFRTSSTSSQMTRSSSQLNSPPSKPSKTTTTTKQETVLKIPGCTAYLVEEGEALELASGDFTIARVVDNNKGGFPLATVVKVGDHLRWPLTRDEPVVRLDSRHYLFSLPMKDGSPLSYGLTFPSKVSSKILAILDSFLAENSCFSGSSTTSHVVSSSSSGGNSGNLEWKQLAPRVEDYNNVLARGIAESTGQIVRGIFMCSNVYSNMVHSCAEMILSGGGGKGDQSYGGAAAAGGMINTNKKFAGGGAKNGGGPQKSLKRVRDLSKMTEELSKAMLDGANVASTSVMAPLLTSQAGKALLASLPGEVVFASLDAINKILDAAEAAEKQALAATTAATTRVVSHKFGEGAAETTGDVLATAGHCTNTAWNVVKFRRAINPGKSAASTAVLRTASRK